MYTVAARATIMERYFFLIFLAIGVCEENYVPSVISVSSVEVPADKVVNVLPDQKVESGNINTNNYYGAGIGGKDYYEGIGGKGRNYYEGIGREGRNYYEGIGGEGRNYYEGIGGEGRNNYKGIGGEGRNYYEGVEGDKFNYARYFGKEYEGILFDKKLSDNEKYERTRGRYRYFGYDYGNPDIHGKIQRPCQIYDVFCIRKFFAEHSSCKISGRQVPDPLYRAQSTFNIPNTNVSATLTNIEYKGIKDGRVEEFYIDKATDNLVITIYFDAVAFATENVMLKYYLRGREPVVTRDAAAAAFLKLSVTLVIPNLNDLKLDKADIFTFTGEPIPPFLAGPRLAISTDPEVPLMFAATLASVPVDAMESLLTEGNFYAANFIQYNICDFGLKVI